MGQNIVFYDDSCGLCNFAVRFLLRQDTRKKLFFAPLTGKTAKVELGEWLKDHASVDSIVLVEKDLEPGKKKILYYSQAFFRILWRIGGFWHVPGLFSFLPSWLLWPSDCVYRVVARNRRGICPYLREPSWHEAHKGQFLD